MNVEKTEDGGFIINRPDRALMALMTLETRLRLEIKFGDSRSQTLAAAKAWGEQLGCPALARARTRKAALVEVSKLKQARWVELYGEAK